ncbi:antibiotic biosynthesis monooxygenase [Saccharibacter sp. 17.LH.SD]|uniref:putative quinol monooxygenase n=1 Tax=Saccharibacter sp. 17.LH.SD TaxID=2689393 RepID=UPI00136CD226|nr:putative quinol monooxygenase [Saccharibacter sp. 17.LH.SD]MXV45118.1 antibiotic biosynthesis monooxygenase [Saccharibacter sp. 17.LH.SD]
MSEAIHILAIITTDADKASAIEKVIRRCAAHSLKEKACRRYEIARDAEKVGRFTVGEVWASQEGFKTHLASSHFGELAETVKAQGAKLEVLTLQPLEPAL